MAMAMDELVLQEDRWFVQLQRGEGLTVIPWEDEPFLVTHVFLVDPESAAGQGVVTASVEMGTRKIMLAELSSEVTGVDLQETPVMLDDEFRLYVTKADGGSNADGDTDEDALVVQFEGYLLWPDTDEESEEEDEEDTNEESEQEDEEDEVAASSEDEDESGDEEDEESDGEVDGDVATTPGGNAKDV